MSRKLTLSILFVFIMKSLINFVYKLMKRNKDTIVVFVHGYRGSYNSFNQLLKRFEFRYHWGKRSDIYYVQKDGSVNWFKSNVKGRKLIQIIFEDNKASFSKYTLWLKNVLTDINHTHKNKEINIVSHSMGGIATIKYLQKFSENRYYPKIKKVVTLGSPFNGIIDPKYFEIHGLDRATKDLKAGSVALQKMLKERIELSEYTEILNIGSVGDEFVTPESVLYLTELIIPKCNNQVKHYIIKRNDLSHSGLHEDEEVDQLIQMFIQ